MTRDSKQKLIAVSSLVSGFIALVLVGSWYDDYELRKLKKMTDAEHVKAAYEAVENSDWITARQHLNAVHPPVVIKPTAEIQAKIDSCLASIPSNDNDPQGMHLQFEACKEKNDPNYRGYAGADTAGCASPGFEQKFSVDERKLIDCTFRPSSCETVVDPHGRKVLCPTEVAVLTDRVNRIIAQTNAAEARQREESEKRAAAEANKPTDWDLLPIEHTKMMPVINAGYWGGGEYRRCTIEVSKNPTFLDCSLEGARREVDVRIDVVFDGSMDHAAWDCKRRETNIYCKPVKTD